MTIILTELKLGLQEIYKFHQTRLQRTILGLDVLSENMIVSKGKILNNTDDDLSENVVVLDVSIWRNSGGKILVVMKADNEEEFKGDVRVEIG